MHVVRRALIRFDDRVGCRLEIGRVVWAQGDGVSVGDLGVIGRVAIGPGPQRRLGVEEVHGDLGVGVVLLDIG